MNLLIVTDTYSPDVNGVARTLETLARGLAARGHRVEVVTTGGATRAADAMTGPAGVAVRRVRSVRLPGYREVRAGLASARFFTGRMTAMEPDAVYVAVETFMGLNALRAARRL